MVYSQRGQPGTVIVARPNNSASWRANKHALMGISAISLIIALGFTAMGAWPILPFAGLELTALGCALYYVSWKLQYRHVITIENGDVHIQKGHYHPRQSWTLQRDETALSVTPENHPWEGPQVSVFSRGENIQLGDFLNKEDRLQLINLLRDDLRVGNHSTREKRDF